ncbi:flagellar motor switch protein FliG [Acuticoccus yangtzensis]|uniref:flagellar motor switch protein FliG n=1 Tax=Acuticoccus yangtzensis TaxID=1443441 RepID=UPI0009497D2B|nr:flagellar motor switch protein FliG [Acuticoccus yangtzensis]ORE95808.1 flagellar motor switch protein FliG [Stappia sp. 22II-S9-Z10]
MPAAAVATTAPPKLPTRPLSNVEKVATILMTMGQTAAGEVMKHLEPPELRTVTHAMAELRPVPVHQIEELVEEFLTQFGIGTNVVGDSAMVQKMLEGILPPEQIADIISEMEGRVNQSIWDKMSGLSEGSLVPYLLNEHPQTAALILTKLAPPTAAKVMSEFPKELRDGVARRMLSTKAVVEESLKLVEKALYEDFMVNLSLSGGGDSHARMADIINKMDREQMEGVLDGLANTHPKSAEILRSLLFTFDDIVKLAPKALTTLFDAIDNSDLVMALKGTEQGFRTQVLSCLAARTRRMVEQELASGEAAPAREVNEARRKITDLALAMGQRGEIDLSTGDDDGGLLQ